MEKTSLFPLSTNFLRDTYARMLLTRMVDECAWKLYEQGSIGFVATSCGHEAAQVGSTICIEVGKDFTLPYYRDLGVVLTIGMTPYEVFRTYLLAYRQRTSESSISSPEKYARIEDQAMLHWGYHKHNMITGPAPVATQILHAAGIAFACKLRKAPAVTVAYCGDGATAEPDFLEGVRFAAQHKLPAIFICELDCSEIQGSVLRRLELPIGLEHRCVDGSDVVAVYASMQEAMQYAREGYGPVLLEMQVVRSIPGQNDVSPSEISRDPIVRCQQLMQEQGLWDEEWASQLLERIRVEVEQALESALRDVQQGE